MIRCHSSSRDVTVGLRRRRALSHASLYVIVRRRRHSHHPALSSYIVSAHLVTCCGIYLRRCRTFSCVIARRHHCILLLCVVVIKWQIRPLSS